MAILPAFLFRIGSVAALTALCSMLVSADGQLHIRSAEANASVTFTVYKIPTHRGYRVSTYGWYIARGSDDGVWFTQDYRGKIGRLSMSGAYTEYSIPSMKGIVGGIAAGIDGTMWFTDPKNAKIGRVTSSGSMTEFTVPRRNLPSGITLGADGAMWFAGSGRIGRVSASGVFTEYALPNPESSPERITAGPDGTLWFTEFKNKLGRITTAGAITEYTVPSARDGLEVWSVNDITLGPDGAMWFTESTAYSHGNGTGKVGRVTTSGTITEFKVPWDMTSRTQSNSGTESITAGPDGALWFIEPIPKKLVRITTSGKVTEFRLPSVVRYPFGIALGPDNALWIADGDSDLVVRAAIGAAR